MAESGFSLVSGGPFHRLATRSFHGEQHPRRLGIALAAITWVPMAVFAGLEWVVRGRGVEIMRDLSVHARLLVAIPALLLSEQMLDDRTRRAVLRCQADGIVHRTGALETAVRRSIALRDSWLAEAIILLGAVLTGLAVLGSWVSAGGLAYGLSRISRSAAWAWYALIGLPVFLFVLYRALWHWLIWCLFLWRLVRAGLQPLVMHPDGAGGLTFLSTPTVAFIPLGLAVNIVFCAGWMTQVWLGTAQASAFRNSLIALVIVEVVVAYLPLCVFMRLLYRTKRRWLFDHGHLGTLMARTFHDRWIVRRPEGSLLDANASSELCDYTSIFGDLQRMRLMPFSLRAVIRFAVIMALPALPVALMSIPLVELIKKLFKLVGKTTV
jgi:hypothetical protein